MKSMGVRSVPTFHVWAAGEKIDSVQGAHVDEVEYLLKKQLFPDEQIEPSTVEPPPL